MAHSSALPGEMAEGLAKASMAAVGVDKNDATLKTLRTRQMMFDIQAL